MDTESEMKSDSELKATLEQKTIQLEKQKVGVIKTETMIIFKRKKMIMVLVLGDYIIIDTVAPDEKKCLL
jgi:hypothetical protein